MAAKAVGELYGVAKKASLVVVRPPRSRRQGNADMVGYTLGTLLDSLGKIADKVVSDPKSTKAVLNLSWGRSFLSSISCWFPLSHHLLLAFCVDLKQVSSCALSGFKG